MTTCNLASQDSAADLIAAQRYLTLRRDKSNVPPETRDAWLRFHQALDELVRRIAFGLLRRTQDLDDCCQYAWLEIIRCLPKLRYDPTLGSPANWLSIVIKRATKRYYVQHSRIQSTLSPVIEEHLPTRASLHDFPSGAIEERELHAVMRQQLTETNYQIACLRWVENRSYDEISKTISVSPDQARRRLYKIRKKLQRAIALN